MASAHGEVILPATDPGFSFRLVTRGSLFPHRPGTGLSAACRLRGRGGLAAGPVRFAGWPQTIVMRAELGKFIGGAGAFLVVVGLVVWSGGMNWFGRLPGDVRVERETVRVYVPIVSM